MASEFCSHSEPEKLLRVFEKDLSFDRLAGRKFPDLRDLARSGSWSDRIASIRVFGRAAAVLYRNADFRGESIMIDRDISDLGQIRGRGLRSWDRQVSSLAIENGRGWRR